MSQKKVDAYKDYKKNKKKILKKEKRIEKFEKGILIGLCVVFVGWLGVSAYQTVTRPSEDEQKAVTATEVNMTNYIDYVNDLSSEY